MKQKMYMRFTSVRSSASFLSMLVRAPNSSSRSSDIRPSSSWCISFNKFSCVRDRKTERVSLLSWYLWSWVKLSFHCFIRAYLLYLNKLLDLTTPNYAIFWRCHWYSNRFNILSVSGLAFKLISVDKTLWNYAHLIRLVPKFCSNTV